MIIQDNDSLTSLSGITHFTTIDRLEIMNNDALTSLDLANLNSIKFLKIAGNDKITNLNGLSNLISIQDLTIEDNSVLENLNGLSNVDSIGALRVSGKSHMTDLTGLNNIFHLNSLTITETDLINLHGLDNLMTVEDIRIENNRKLNSLDGLSGLNVFFVSFVVSDNAGLVNINALSNLGSVISSSVFIITNNQSLSEFCGLFKLLKNGYPDPLSDIFFISGNAQNPSKQEIIEAGPCETDSVYTGDLYLTKQAQIDTFSYNVITGHLCIFEQTTGSITNLNGLAKLRSVGSLLIVQNNLLTNLDSLSNLKFAGDVGIKNNPSLLEFCGLYNLVTLNGLTGNLLIRGNGINPTEEDIKAAGPCPETDMDGIVSDVTDLNIPTEYTLSQNYPNPFNPSTTIKYSLPEAAFVKLKVYNSLGELVKIIVNETKEAGYYEISFEASSLSSGMYIYKLEAGNFVSSEKMILLK